jgi:hypothetical protein
MKFLHYAALATSLVLACSSFAQVKRQTCDWRNTAPTFVRSPIQMDTHAGYRTFIFKTDGTIGLRVHGDFPHAAFVSFTVYDNGIVHSVLTDRQIVPDQDSVNPFSPGELVQAPNRSFTITVLPDGKRLDSIPNVLTMPPIPNGSTVNTVAFEERIYLPEPGPDRYGGDAPTIEAFDINDPSTPVACPLRDDSVNPDESTAPDGTHGQSPLPVNGIIQFYRPPVMLVPFADASRPLTPHDCTSYLEATVFPDQIAVVHLHKVPAFFNNTNVGPTTTFAEPTDGARYISMGSYGASVLFANDGENVAGPEITTLPDGSATFVAIPISLTPSDYQLVHDKAKELGYNPMPLANDGTLFPGPEPSPEINPFLIYREKLPTPGFEGDINNIGCFHNPKFNQAPDPAFAASPKNMGEYAPIGVECTLDGFLYEGCGQESHYPHP